MPVKPLQFLLCFLVPSVIFLHGAEDSPVFVIQNQPAPAGAATLPASGQSTRATLPDGRVVTTSLDGAALTVRLGEAAAQVIDPHASRECPPALASFADGSALLVWRGHGKDGLRDLRYARFDEGAWQPAAMLSHDDWRTESDPFDEGPALHARGPHVAVAWFTAADGPRINVSTSSNAGIQWLMPVRVDDVTPIGRVSLVLLDDGAQLVSWVERADEHYLILLRRVSPRSTLSVPVQLARLTTDPGHPRLTLVKDGDATPAQLLLAYTERNAPLARLITLPSPASLAEAEACDCDPRPEELRGYALRGKITGVDAKARTITLTHGDIPGVMKTATTAFKAAPNLIAAAKPGQRVFARTERIGPDWCLFNIRPLATP